MTIHSEHPFLPPEDERDPLRRLRGRMPAPVSIWTSEDSQSRDGWTISSFLVADGQPAELVALVDEDSDWWEVFCRTGLATVNVLASGQGPIADVFARVAPSPGGPFRTGDWESGSHGPRLKGAAAWVEVALADEDPTHAGWGLLVRARVEGIEVAGHEPALGHLRGRYL